MIGFFKRRRKPLAVFFVLVNLFQIVSPGVTYALTSGPTQPEVQSFQPVGASDMVDLFSGDFSYNIPLFELPGPNGGYPFNLSYQSGIGMDQEASWVGLGWSMQPGAITRQLRGLPDEFDGDVVKTKMDIAPNITVGLGAGVNVELFGKSKEGKNGQSSGGSGSTGSTDAAKWSGELGIGFSVYKNTYRGMGYSIDPSVGFEKTMKGMTANIGLNFSLDTQEGIGVSPSLSLDGKMGGFGLSAGYNTMQGFNTLSLSASVPRQEMEKSKDPNKKEKAKWGMSNASGTSTLSLAHPGYTPQITMPMRGNNLSLTLKVGVAFWGVFGSPYIKGFYNKQVLDKNDFSTKAYGYLNYQNAGGADLMDFNREKDGMITERSPNLGLPSLTFDIYSVTGQGIGMMYRPMRNDYGVVHDQETSSVSTAIGVGVDIAPALVHVGGNLDVTYSSATSGKWAIGYYGTPAEDAFNGKAGFVGKDLNSNWEPWYFKVHGEPTSEKVTDLQDVGGDKAVMIQLNQLSADAITVTDKFVSKPKATATFNPKTKAELKSVKSRKPRNQAVQPITNRELLGDGTVGSEVLNQFLVKYQDASGQEKVLDRTDPKRLHHFAGYTATTTEGLRYVYGIPAYNTKQVDVVYSTNTLPDGVKGRVPATNQGGTQPDYKKANTDEFLKQTEMPAYAHSYLLTSILGPDYVDVDNNGVSEKDLGYWVKFTYEKVTTDAAPYKWRDPFTGAHFQEGWKANPRDNKGSFSYGEKELWYLTRAETKSHIATFKIETRDDARGVQGQQQDQALLGASSYRLKNITLFTRESEKQHLTDPENIVPIKVTHFEYDYALCHGVENNATGEGKLTLKSVKFAYGKTKRQINQLNAYTFKYNNEGASGISYSALAYDRWGNYKALNANDPLYNKDFPYVDQDPSHKNDIDQNAAAWSLKEITLPSGGTILVDYESDDYAYVQSKQAMQMTSFVDPSVNTPGTSTWELKDTDCRIKFKLEKPIPDAGMNQAAQAAEVKKYLDNTGMVYFKMLVNLYKKNSGIWEYVEGYVNVDPSDATKGLERANRTDASGPYVYGYFTVVKEHANSNDFHPFSLRAWQHLRTDQPNLMLVKSKKEIELNSGAPGITDDKTEKVNQVQGLAGLAPHIKTLFKGFYRTCRDDGRGREVDANKSWVRLNSVDKFKYGGGLRVKQITLKDNWKDANHGINDEEGIYGQYYDYTTTETINNQEQTISSGVAAYEPVVGGEENPMRYAKRYTQKMMLRSNNNLYFEYPVNETYYPAAQVGYSKVTVMSLGSAARLNATLPAANKVPLSNLKLSDNKDLYPSDQYFGTSGKTVHEFYTAKDFPVITDETPIDGRSYHLNFPIPYLGAVNVNRFTASQGYSVVVNDMHGKQKKVSSYRQDKTGAFEIDAYSSVEYNYWCREMKNGSAKWFELQNGLKDNKDGTLSKPVGTVSANEAYALGQEVEMFHDMRQNNDENWSGGAKINMDGIIVPIIGMIPVGAVWPSVSYGQSLLRTTVTNKIIYRTGILLSVKATDEGSVVTTENVKWDKQTGSVVLNKVINNFNDPVYSYTIPAYQKYQGMGAAFQNVGLTFSINDVKEDANIEDHFSFSPDEALNQSLLYPGDEIVLYPQEIPLGSPVAKAIYLGNNDGDNMFYCENNLIDKEYYCMIVRSGYRNQLTIPAGSITALSDPSVPGTKHTYTKIISVPK